MTNLTLKYLEVSKFSKLLLKWHETDNHRKMPWKGEKDAYRVWLSEIILQQTRVEQGLAYYNNFVNNFPTIAHLAGADEKKVFKLWEGLGYYSRCRNLIATAKLIRDEYGGHFPSQYDNILKLKGVGPYTAAAIASFAFNLPYAVIDGNVYRVLARIYGIADPIDSTAGKKKFSQLAADLLDKKQPGKHNQAIMDFGATICKPLAPLCPSCIFQKHCAAFASNRVHLLPAKEKKIRQKHRFFYFFLLQQGSKIAIRERLKKDIWQHLHEFPVIEFPEEASITTAMAQAVKRDWISENDTAVSVSGTYRQKLTHQTISAVFTKIVLTRQPGGLNNYDWVEMAALPEFSFPKIINDYLNQPPDMFQR